MESEGKSEENVDAKFRPLILKMEEVHQNMDEVFTEVFQIKETEINIKYVFTSENFETL